MSVSISRPRLACLVACIALLAGCERAPAGALPEPAGVVATTPDPVPMPTATDPVPAAMPDDADTPPDAAAGATLEEVDGAIGDIEPVRTLLFADSGVLEESITTHAHARRKHVVLAIGRADVATFVVYLLQPADTQPDDRTRSRYLVASRVLPEPPDVLDGSAQVDDVQVGDASGRIVLALALRHDVMQPGGDAAGEPASRALERTLRLVFDPATGTLEPDDG